LHSGVCTGCHDSEVGSPIKVVCDVDPKVLDCARASHRENPTTRDLQADTMVWYADVVRAFVGAKGHVLGFVPIDGEPVLVEPSDDFMEAFCTLCSGCAKSGSCGKDVAIVDV